MINRPVVFVHIPRTSGTALKNNIGAAIRVHTGRGIKTNYDAHVVAGATRDDVRGLGFLAGHTGYGMHRLFDDPFVFTMLRNPIQRAVSMYKFVQRVGHHYLHDVAGDMSLQQFAMDERTRHIVSNYQTRYIAYDYDMHALMHDSGYFDPAGFTKYFESHDPVGEEERFELCKQALHHKFHFFGISELFHESLAILQETLGLPVVLPKRRFVAENHLDGVDHDTKETLVRINALDIRLYGYAIQLFKERTKDESPLSDNSL